LRHIARSSPSSPPAHRPHTTPGAPAGPTARGVEGLATGSGFDLPQQILSAHLTDFRLVDDSAIRAAQWLMMRDAQTLTEGAAAAPLAAYLAEPDRFTGRTVALICTGANASAAEIRDTVPAEAS
jgi:threonine dehydratase